MAHIDDLTLPHRVFMKAYRYRSVDWSPGARLAKPLAETKFALITTAGLHLPDQPAFDLEFRGGDFSFREIAPGTDVQQLRIAQRSSEFDRTGVLQDKNLVFPLERFRELVERRVVGGLNRRHFSFMGSISAPGRLIAQSAPEVAKKLRADQVEAVFLTPV
jgi:D-proline reductase (dithiol) PrdB